MLKAEHLPEQRVRENAANCEQLKSELERIQQRQRELDMQKGLSPRREWLPAQDHSRVWRWTKLLDRKDDLTLTARLRSI